MRGLKGRRAIITGGASGIGRAIATRLLDEGGCVGIFDIAAPQAIGKDASKSKAYQVDVTDYAAVLDARDAYYTDFEFCNVLVNCVGWDNPKMFLESDPENWDRIIAVNLRAHLNMHHTICPGMVARKWGRVVNIVSDAARIGAGRTAVYSACKGGIIAFTKSMARELARHNVLVNAVSPGPTRTPLLAGAFEGEEGQKWVASVEKAIPLRRLGEPEDIAGMVAFLASDDAEYMTGQVISVSGGLTMSD